MFDAAGDSVGLAGAGLAGLGPEELYGRELPPDDGRARLRSFRLRFSASSCFLFFLTEGFS